MKISKPKLFFFTELKIKFLLSFYQRITLRIKIPRIIARKNFMDRKNYNKSKLKSIYDLKKKYFT